MFIFLLYRVLASLPGMPPVQKNIRPPLIPDVLPGISRADAVAGFLNLPFCSPGGFCRSIRADTGDFDQMEYWSMFEHYLPADIRHRLQKIWSE